jgi:hypothetical protein
MEPIRSSDPVSATAWLDDDTPSLEGDDVHAHAELTDVDEVGLIVRADTGEDVLLMHLPRVQAIALAGQLAWAATASPAALPSGHGPEGPIA